MSVLSLGKIDKYRYFAGEKIFFSDQSRMIEQAYLLSFRKSLRKTIKTN